ncbi:hypothetical protein ABKN59_008921 [Abortiporus biennis]
MQALDREVEIGMRERSIVDDSFDEGQYTVGLSTFDQLRDPSSRPYPPHIRQLIFISLYPPPDKTGDSFDEDIENINQNGMPTSPSKLGGKQSRSAFEPTPQDSLTARSLLLDFAFTNSPPSLMRALPSYGHPHLAKKQNLMDFAKDDDAEPLSYIAKRARSLVEAKNCWEVLKEDFVQRIPTSSGSAKNLFGEGTSTPSQSQSRKKPGRSSKRKKTSESEDESGSQSGVANGENKKLVGEYSWNLLEWIVILFERDEEKSTIDGLPQFSPLLLSQIPPPRSGTGGRWDIDSPLGIVSYCIAQDNEHHKLLGVRLLTLLINLTSTIYVDFPMFLNATCSRLLSSLSWNNLSFLLMSLPSTASTTLLNFKLIFYRKFLEDACRSVSPCAAGGRVGPTSAKPPARRAVPARARPKAAAATGDVSSGISTPSSIYSIASSSTLSSLTGTSITSIESLGIEKQYPEFRLEDVTKLLSAEFPGSNSSGLSTPRGKGKEKEILHVEEKDNRTLYQVLEIKYLLLSAYLALQRLSPTSSSSLSDLLSNGKLITLIEETFKYGDGLSGTSEAFVITRGKRKRASDMKQFEDKLQDEKERRWKGIEVGERWLISGSVSSIACLVYVYACYLHIAA